MSIKRYKREQVVTLLRRIEVGIANLWRRPVVYTWREVGLTIDAQQ